MVLVRMHVRTLPVLGQHAHAHVDAPARSNGDTASWELMPGPVWAEQSSFGDMAIAAGCLACLMRIMMGRITNSKPTLK